MAAKATAPAKKGGARFPRISLEKAVQYAAKLVSKTHTGPQPESLILPGVFGKRADSGRGRIEASALKQYGLLQGKADAYSATDLAKKISVAAGSEKTLLLRSACLNPVVFKTLFETYHGDKVTLAKIKQQAASANVHPDELDNCADLFADSASYAALAARTGDELTFVAAADVPGDGITAQDEALIDDDAVSEKAEEHPDTQRKIKDSAGSDESRPSARSVIHVNVTLDSSLDTDKLERQLEILRRFGAI